mmetsp:Transcript_32481/g.63971  ORF Transcript_32481/g.63971 Transcript_32481/m.63971 type:complete len:243 (+) Transcript_32481:88-816(+)
MPGHLACRAYAWPRHRHLDAWADEVDHFRHDAPLDHAKDPGRIQSLLRWQRPRSACQRCPLGQTLTWPCRGGAEGSRTWRDGSQRQAGRSAPCLPVDAGYGSAQQRASWPRRVDALHAAGGGQDPLFEGVPANQQVAQGCASAVPSASRGPTADVLGCGRLQRRVLVSVGRYGHVPASALAFLTKKSQGPSVRGRFCRTAAGGPCTRSHGCHGSGRFHISELRRVHGILFGSTKATGDTALL